jgi:hypothetical protein
MPHVLPQYYGRYANYWNGIYAPLLVTLGTVGCGHGPR